MICPIGTKTIEKVMIRFGDDIRVNDLANIVDNYNISVIVNEIIVAKSPLFTLPIQGGWVAFKLDRPAKAGDNVVVKLENFGPDLVIPYGITFCAALTIYGEIILEGQEN